jgi:superfamily I DNA/RNA helicase
MKRFRHFTAWLIESTLQNQFSEAILRFSQKYVNKDVNEVPSGFWTWVRDKMNEDPRFHPRIEDDDGSFMSRDKVLQLIDQRAANRRYGASAPAPVERRPERQPEPTPAQTGGQQWILAKVVDIPGFQKGDFVVVTKNGTNWTAMTRDAKTKDILGGNVRTAIESVKKDDKPMTAQNPEELWKYVDTISPKPEQKKPPGLPAVCDSSEKNPHILSEKNLQSGTGEGWAIDQKFARMMSNDKQTHMMINALAGTGKTTTLKHLAWKYGKKGQRWLYLVFNNKNAAEAEEYDKGCRKFPEFVEVATTNSFLGEALEHKKNKGRLPQTKRIADLAKLGLKGKKIEKARFIADGQIFQTKMKEEFGIPFKNEVDENLLREFGVTPRSMKYYLGAVGGVIGQIRKQFQERVLTLLDRLKSFGTDPRKNDSLEAAVRKVFDKYDAHEDPETKQVTRGYFDTELEEVKERVDDYDDDFRAVVTKVLQELMGYDFMSKDYREEIIAGATWLLKEALPKASQQTVKTGYGRGEIEHKLGDYRDFNDDLWYSAIHSDDMHWDKYDVVLADEVQDFNETQKIMLKKLHEAGAKIVAVGDKNQGIYRFRGADGDAFGNISNTLKDLSHDKDDWKENTLTRNFRSRKCILDFVNQRTHVKNLVPGKYLEEEDEKCRVTDEDYKYTDIFKMIKDERRNKEIKGTAFIARTNEPLVHASLKLLVNAVPFIIVGKDVAGDLIKHIEYLIEETVKESKFGRGREISQNSPITDLQNKVIQFAEKEEEMYGDKATKRHYLQELKDTTMAITNTIEQFAGPNPDKINTPGGAYRRGDEPDDIQQNKSVAEYMDWVKKNLSGFDIEDKKDLSDFKKKIEEENPVILTTAHKSKGLEFSRVFILRDDQFPHPKSKHPDEIAQEDNAKYVAYTRAMDELHIVKLKGQPGYKDGDDE